MNRSELVDAISERSGVSKNDVDATLKGFLDVVAGVVARGGDKITIPGWLSIEQGSRSARTARNPQTGETINVPASKTAKISAGSKLKAIANGKEAPPS